MKGSHLEAGTISRELLSPDLLQELAESKHTPVLAPVPAPQPQQRQAVQQEFGLEPFSFDERDDQTDVEIVFSEPFADGHYALSASSDHSSCYVAVKSKLPDRAVLTVVRTRIGPVPSGTVNWIALGKLQQ